MMRVLFIVVSRLFDVLSTSVQLPLGCNLVTGLIGYHVILNVPYAIYIDNDSIADSSSLLFVSLSPSLSLSLSCSHSLCTYLHYLYVFGVSRNLIIPSISFKFAQ